jgi:hypothetical protein
MRIIEAVTIWGTRGIVRMGDRLYIFEASRPGGSMNFPGKAEAWDRRGNRITVEQINQGDPRLV